MEKEKNMKSLVMGLVVSLAFLGVSGFAAQKQQTITGEVMDSSCAKMGSHEMMEKQHNMPASAASDKACTTACVKAGAKLVLYDASTKTAYEIDDQKKAEQFAGEKVKVTGTVDAANSSIHIAKIAKAS
jgi:type 1 fimbria pilin